MRRFGGLRYRMPYTCWTFLVGGLALSGIFPLAGFFSKDEILAALRAASHASESHARGWSGAYMAVYWIAVLTAFMTAFYTFRAFFRTFFGPEKLPSPDDPEAEEEAAADAAAQAHASPERVISAHGSSHADPGHGHGHGHDAGHGHDHDAHLGHESPPIMTIPLIILAVCAATVGIIFGPTHLFEHHLGHTFGFETLGHAEHRFDVLTAIVGTIAGVLGIALAWVLYGRPSPVPARLASQLRPLYLASYNKFWVDEFYDWVVIRPLWAVAAVLAFLDENLVHGLVRATAWVPRLFGREVLAPFQNGLIQFYAAVTALGVTGLLWILLMS
jgi:NADH-quinone oxidoreductase subunit L